MKIIIAGGRDYKFTKEDVSFLEDLFFNSEYSITEVVSGGANGADREGEKFAEDCDIPLRIFTANWDKYKNAAGPIRNQKMADYADGVILFPGGKGTKDMYERAYHRNLLIWDVRKGERSLIPIKPAKLKVTRLINSIKKEGGVSYRTYSSVNKHELEVVTEAINQKLVTTRRVDYHRDKWESLEITLIGKDN